MLAKKLALFNRLNRRILACSLGESAQHPAASSQRCGSSKTRCLGQKRCLSSAASRETKPAFTRIVRSKKPKVTSALDAVSSIGSNAQLYVQMGVNTPQALVAALTQHIKENNLKNITIHQLLTLGLGKDWKPLHESGAIRGNSFFTSGENRPLINSGIADYTPIFLSDASRYFEYGPVQLDAVLTQVSPRDKYGYYTLGATLICINEAIRNSKLLICQVNKNIPRTFGDTTIHESQIDFIVEQDAPLAELPEKAFTEEDIKIGKLIAENFVEDGSTLQMGIGSIPGSVLSQCKDFKNLGIHSEMVSDGVVDLHECGAVTNHLKVVEKDHTAVTFALGSRKIYNYLDDNPAFVFRSGFFVNDETVICQNPKLVAINSCLEIDLQGQVAADALGKSVYSGFGGQIDFLRAASISKDGKGKPILAVNSTAKGESKIKVDLRPQSSVVSTRAHVWYVVTEYGIANLFGKTLRQRAYELIQIAHPKFREELERGAFEKLGCMPSKD